MKTFYTPLQIISILDCKTHYNFNFLYNFRQNTMTVDRFLMVYDMRVMRAMAPIQVVIDPMFLRFIHIYNNKLMVVSQVTN